MPKKSAKHVVALTTVGLDIESAQSVKRKLECVSVVLESIPHNEYYNVYGHFNTTCFENKVKLVVGDLDEITTIL